MASKKVKKRYSSTPIKALRHIELARLVNGTTPYAHARIELEELGLGEERISFGDGWRWNEDALLAATPDELIYAYEIASCTKLKR